MNFDSFVVKISKVVYMYINILIVIFSQINTCSFSMRIFTPPDGNWGSRSKNGSWNGMVDLLMNKVN